MNDTIIIELAEKFYRLGEKLGFTKWFTRSDSYSHEIYVLNGHALEMEIDLRENELFIYAVRLYNEALPDESVIYRYDNGEWCRKFLEEIYEAKRPQIKDVSKRYSEGHLLDALDFYARLIEENPEVLSEFMRAI